MGLPKEKIINQRLKNLGIKKEFKTDDSVSISLESFQTTMDTGSRMLILYTIAFVVHNLDQREDIIKWLNKEGLWEKLAASEVDFFLDENPSEDLLMELSWRFESALTLAWALNLINDLPELDNEASESSIDEFISVLPG